MNPPDMVLRGKRGSTWALFASAMLLADLIIFAAVIGVDVSATYVAVAVVGLVSTVRTLLKGPCELRVYPDRYEVHQGSRRIARVAYEGIDYFRVSAMAGRVGFVFDQTRIDPAKQLARRSPLMRAWYAVFRWLTGVDGHLQSQYRGMTSRRLAALMNGKLKRHRASGWTSGDTRTGVMMVSAMVTEGILQALRDSRGVRAENALAALGSLMGFSSAASATARLRPDGSGINIIRTTDGREWLFGDAINGVLFEDDASAMKPIGESVQKLGGELPDLVPIIKRLAGTVGSEAYGRPELPPENMPSLGYQMWIDKLWADVESELNKRVPSRVWPYVFAMSIEKVLMMSRGQIDPSVAGKIVAEYALAACHLDPRPYAVLAA